MCIRYDSWRDGYFVWKDGIEYELRPDDPAVLAQTDSIFPGKPGPFVIVDPAGVPQMITGSWGLPRNITRKGKWVKERYYNARSETIHKLGVFKEAFTERRCLVPASAFYERDEGFINWYRFFPKDKSPLTFAGLYDLPNEATGVQPFGFATTEPNGVVSQMHDRMPVLLDKEGIELWLDPAASVDDLRGILAPAPEDMLAFEFAEVVQRGPKKKDA